MSCYWLDASVFIQAYRNAYGFDIAPGFWEALQKYIEKGILRSPTMVLGEITEVKDSLADWARGLEDALFVESDTAVQMAYTPISDHILKTYKRYWAQRFLKGADGWVIAHAQVDKGTVVSQEIDSRRERAKIPVVSRTFGVEHINSYDLLRKLGIKLRYLSP
jgi:Domain of unknown function (DUF4411)